MTGGEQTSQAVEARDLVVVALWRGYRLSHMKGHPHPQRSGFGPWLIGQSALGCDRAGDGISGDEEGRLRRIADELVEGVVVLFNR